MQLRPTAGQEVRREDESGVLDDPRKQQESRKCRREEDPFLESFEAPAERLFAEE